jgi:hypothetical protein
MGVHEGKELALMLSGEKPMARFTIEPNYTPNTKAFKQHIESGRIIEIRAPSDRGCENLYFCLPGEEWRARLSEFIFNGAEWNLTEEDLHRMDGFLLGYDKHSIQEFIEHWRTHEPRPL